MMESDKRLRVALVGANASGSGWGPIAHMPAIAAVEQLELVALCTSSPTSAAAAAERYGIARAYHDLGELAAQPDIDLVAVAVKVPHHHSIVMPLLEAGKNVYCEWPLGANVEEAEAMVSAARSSRVVAVVGLQGRHDPALRYIKELVDGGQLGDVLSINVTMLGGGALSHNSSEAWMADDSNGANTMTIVAGHTLDYLEYCFGELEEISATVGVQVPQWRLEDTGEVVDADAPDNILLNGTLSGGGIVSYQAASVPYNGSGWRMEAYGTEGTVVATTAVMPQISPVTLTGARGDAPLVPLEVPANLSNGLAVPDGPGHNIARSYARMADAIGNGTTAEPDFGRALEVHRLLELVRKSSDERRAIGART